MLGVALRLEHDFHRTGAQRRAQHRHYSLRHVFATWALAQPGLRIEDVSRLLGHSSIRVTQDIYIHVHGDLYQRFYQATE